MHHGGDDRFETLAFFGQRVLNTGWFFWKRLTDNKAAGLKLFEFQGEGTGANRKRKGKVSKALRSFEEITNNQKRTMVAQDFGYPR